MLRSDKLYINKNEKNIENVIYNFTIDFLKTFWTGEDIENNIKQISYTINKMIESLLNKSKDINNVYIEFYNYGECCNHYADNICITIKTNDNKRWDCSVDFDFMKFKNIGV